MPLVTLEQARDHLRIDAGVDDDLVVAFIVAATRAVELHTGRTVAPGATTFGNNDAKVAAQAALLLISTWYENRNALPAGGGSSEMPFAVTWLLWPLKRLSV